MKKKIFCTFLKCISEQQEFQIYPGKLGEKIFNKISKIAWNKWVKEQTVLINEKKLNLKKEIDRKFLEDKMIDYLFKKKYKR